MENIELSRNYRTVWKEARKNNSFEALETVFFDLCDEIGHSDSTHIQINETNGTAAALRKNAQEAPGIKRQP